MKAITINMIFKCLTTIFESLLTQRYIFLDENMLFMICAENLLQQMLKTFYNRYSKKYDFSQNIYFLCEILSKIVLKKLEIMFVVIAF